MSALRQEMHRLLPGQAPAAEPRPVTDSADTRQAGQATETAAGHINEAQAGSQAGRGAERCADGAVTETAPSALPAAESSREVRAGALKLLAGIWSRFPAQAHEDPVFARFFPAVAPLTGRIATEVRTAHCKANPCAAGSCPRLDASSSKCGW